ncbi:MAG: hypothetical protein SCH71_16925, partial [Desulfobulbaceae bacterium]|nr:hypothetical protein [Desulfobulbaceae bacterium]
FDFIVHFFARPKKRTKKMTPVTLGPSDCIAFMPFGVLLEAAWILKTREVYAPKGCSNSSKSFNGIFSGAHQVPMGKNLKCQLKKQSRPVLSLDPIFTVF